MRVIKADLWDAIYTACKNVNSKDIETPTNSLELQTCPYYVLLSQLLQILTSLTGLHNKFRHH